MTAQENMNLIRAWVDAVNRNDVEGELACWQPDGEMTIIATGATSKGHAALRRRRERSAAMVSAQSLAGRKHITNHFASEEWVCVEYHSRATITGLIEMRGVTIIPEGISRAIDTEVCVIAHIRDGKMDSAREYFDSATFARQLEVESASVAAMYSTLLTDAGS
jgi:ketosteroid isomerase-like protein